MLAVLLKGAGREVGGGLTGILKKRRKYHDHAF